MIPNFPGYTGSEKDFDFLAKLCADMTLRLFGFQFTPIQLKKSREIIKRTLRQERFTIVFSECRQVGKTETVCYTEFFLSYAFPALTGERYRVCFTAPEKGTSLEIFDRTKKLFDTVERNHPQFFKFERKTPEEIIIPQCAKFEIFGLFKGYAKREDKKSTKEGRTFHKVIRDEMHLGEDDIFSDEIEPAMSTTGGVDLWIGNGGYRQCDAKKKIETGSNENQTVFFYDYKFMRKEYLRLFEETGNPMFKRWIQAQDKYIEDKGEESDLVQKNLFNKWIVERGNFVAPEKLHRCRRAKERTSYNTDACDVGVDWAKSHDSTVVTVTDYERNIRFWLELHGEDYIDQVDIIEDWLRDLYENHGIEFGTCYCDSTGAGDAPTTLLQRKCEDFLIVEPVVFTPLSKDEIGKKMLKAIFAKHADERLSYPNPKISKMAKKFERQMTELEKEYRGESGKLNYHHPDRHDAHDDFPDSFGLSIYGMEDLEDEPNVYFV